MGWNPTRVFPEKGPAALCVSGASCFHAGQGRHPTKRSRQAVSDKATDIANLLAPTVVSLGLELLGVESAGPGGATLRLYIDVPLAEQPERTINVDDCERVSREVSAQLDVEDPISGNYTLEVSSWVDRPLFNLEQFARHQGESAKVTLKLPDGRRLQGAYRGDRRGCGHHHLSSTRPKWWCRPTASTRHGSCPTGWRWAGPEQADRSGTKRPKPNTNSSSNEPAARSARSEPMSRELLLVVDAVSNEERAAM